MAFMAFVTSSMGIVNILLGGALVLVREEWRIGLCDEVIRFTTFTPHPLEIVVDDIRLGIAFQCELCRFIIHALELFLDVRLDGVESGPENLRLQPVAGHVAGARVDRGARGHVTGSLMWASWGSWGS